MGGIGSMPTLGGGGGLNQEFAVRLFGKEFGLWGTRGFFLTGVAYDAAVFALFLFQMVFMDAAATILMGAMAERWKFATFVIFGFFIATITSPLFAHLLLCGVSLSLLAKYLCR